MNKLKQFWNVSTAEEIFYLSGTLIFATAGFAMLVHAYIRSWNL